MSGFVRTTFAFARISGRSACGVSPSKTAAFSCGSFSARIPRSWSRASAFVGNRKIAVAFGTVSASVAAAIWYTSDFPLAVPVASTTFRPARSDVSPSA